MTCCAEKREIVFGRGAGCFQLGRVLMRRRRRRRRRNRGG
jgi:hypothetical protein